MGEYLKMADVFDCEVESDADLMFSDSLGSIADFSGYKTQCRYATHAINSHDELVVEVERLRGENDAIMKCRMAAREFFNCTVASGGSVKVSSANKAALDEADKASDWLEIELKATADLVKK